MALAEPFEAEATAAKTAWMKKHAGLAPLHEGEKLTKEEAKHNATVKAAEKELVDTLTDIRDRLAKALADAGLTYAFGPQGPEITPEQIASAQGICAQLEDDEALFDKMMDGMTRRGYGHPWDDYDAFKAVASEPRARQLVKWQKYRLAWEARQAKAGDIS